MDSPSETPPLVEEPAVPFPDALAHLQAHLQLVRLALSRLHRLDGEEEGADEDGEGLSAARLARLEEESASLEAEVARRLSCSLADRLPIEVLRRRFSLSPRALRILLAAAAPAVDLELARAFAAVAEDGSSQPTVATVVELLARDPGDHEALLDELEPTAPLSRWRLVSLGTARGWSPAAPLLHRPLHVPDRVVALLRGGLAFSPERFERVARLRRPSERETLPEAVERMLERALFRERDGRRLPLIVAGPSLSGKTTSLVVVAGRRGLPVLEADLEAVSLAGRPAELVSDLLREARLQDALLVLRGGDLLGDKQAELRRAVVAAMSDGSVWCALTTRGDLGDLPRRLPGAHLFRLALPSAAEQEKLWAQVLPPEVPREPGVELGEIVRRYRLTPGDILEAGADAASRARVRGPESAVSLDDVIGAVRHRLRHRLGDVAELVTTNLTWDDLVLRDEALERIGELLAAVRYRDTVMTDWGFARKLAYGRATSALFSGPPGTGKTMVATLIAQDLGLELFRVDLSRVVSKWIGETEKNLGRAFDEATNAQAILLFDEADSLFAKRSEVKSSNDRYANLEVNYLLQRLETFEGIVLLTTNNAQVIDEAFRRRLRFRLEFPPPDEDERERLWRALLPAAAPLEAGVDFRALAERYEMSGGYIKNAVVRAAYLAAADEAQVITQAALLEAASREWEDSGKLTRR